MKEVFLMTEVFEYLKNFMETPECGKCYFDKRIADKQFCYVLGGIKIEFNEIIERVTEIFLKYPDAWNYRFKKIIAKMNGKFHLKSGGNFIQICLPESFIFPSYTKRFGFVKQSNGETILCHTDDVTTDNIIFSGPLGKQKKEFKFYGAYPLMVIYYNGFEKPYKSVEIKSLSEDSVMCHYLAEMFVEDVIRDIFVEKTRNYYD